jgi:3D (Asp-Asp-Asp) domain-containing protein/sulfur carrier protein ThiS
VLSLGLLIPFGAGTVPDRVAKTVAALAAPAPAKHVTLVHDGLTETIETQAATAEDLLAERGVIRAPEDALSVDPASPVTDGETVTYRAAVPVTVVVDGTPHTLRSAAPTVADLLAQQAVAFDRHDAVSPPPSTALENDTVVTVKHVDSWTETVRKKLAAHVVKRWAYTLPAGKTTIVDRGAPGVAETAYVVTRTPDRRTLRRTALVSRILRAPRARIVAEGIGEYTALSALAQKGIQGTLRLASSALSMVATAYTAGCGGCSGVTASGRPAGHGVVAVDPSVIPLGTRMYIPGYGHAVAGDTGGAIRGHRIDLGFNSNAEANQFGRRPITVYLIK